MKIAGIYKLVSPNGKVYIGQSWNVHDRWSDYINLRRSSIGRRLYNSLKKYDPKNFSFSLLEEVENNISQEILDELEIKYWKQSLEDGKIMLNSRDCGGSKGKHSEETKKLMSLASLGKLKSEVHKKNLSLSKLAKPNRFWEGKLFSEEHKNKLSLAKKGKSSKNKGAKNPKLTELYRNKYKVIINDEEFEYYNTKTELRKILSLSFKTFNKILSGKTCKKIKPIKIYEF